MLALPLLKSKNKTQQATLTYKRESTTPYQKLTSKTLNNIIPPQLPLQQAVLPGTSPGRPDGLFLLLPAALLVGIQATHRSAHE